MQVRYCIIDCFTFAASSRVRDCLPLQCHFRLYLYSVYKKKLIWSLLWNKFNCCPEWFFYDPFSILWVMCHLTSNGCCVNDWAAFWAVCYHASHRKPKVLVSGLYKAFVVEVVVRVRTWIFFIKYIIFKCCAKQVQPLIRMKEQKKCDQQLGMQHQILQHRTSIFILLVSLLEIPYP